MSPELDLLTKNIIEQLNQLGWTDKDILIAPSIYFEKRVYRPDIILLYNLFPIAIIEVKSEFINPQSAVEQLILYSEASGINSLFVMNGVQVLEVNSNNKQTIVHTKLPTATDLWNSLGNDYDERDPRIHPPIPVLKTPSILQVQAIKESIETVINGQKRQLINFPVGYGKSFVEAQIIWKLINSGYFNRALIIVERIEQAYQLEKTLKPFNGEIHFSRGKNNKADSERDNYKIHIELSNNIIKNSNLIDIASKVYDLIVIDDAILAGINKISQIIEMFPEVAILAFSPSIRTTPFLVEFFGKPIFKASIEEIVETQSIIPPVGFSSVQLSEIAEVRTGLAINRKSPIDASQGKEVLMFTARNILPGGILSLNEITKINLPEDENASTLKDSKEKYLIQPQDILLSAIGGKTKIALVPDEFPNEAYFSSSLIRIRVKSNIATSKEVFDFLRSEVGQLALLRNTKGLAQQLITSRDLIQMQIFLPEKKGENPDKSDEELTVVNDSLRKIKQEVIPRLEKIQHENEITASEEIEIVTALLKKITSNLTPPLLEEEVMNHYPTPIALAYRRFRDSRFNVYEQVLRLRDLFEATSFFIYNVFLADAFLNLNPIKYRIEDKRVRKAYDGYSMAFRIDFVETILEIARLNEGQDLFIPELLETDFVSLARKLQGEFRNSFSHTATATESKMHYIIESFKPVVERMLVDLKFLMGYQLVRIPSFQIKHGNLVRRMEVYKGTAPDLVEQTVEGNLVSNPAENDHLVLLDSENNVLDCHPLYQLHSSENTRYETHLCFLKQTKLKERKLEGESVNGAFEIELEGFVDFELLKGRWGVEA